MNAVNLLQSTGGPAGCRKLAQLFYARVARDPILRPLFPGKTFTCAIEEFSAFLVQFLGGPAEQTQRRWWLSLRESHLRFRIGAKERAAWMKNMTAALDEMQLEEPARDAFLRLFDQSSAYVVNAGPAPATGRAPEGDLTARWHAQLALDEAVAALRRGDTPSAIALLERTPNVLSNRSVFAAVLALMTGIGDQAMLSFVRSSLTQDPALMQVRFSGRTLLHAAAAAGNLDLVRLLLHLGAAPDVLDSGSHTPLYSLANECRAGGAGVAQALADAGADVNASGGVKRCTALHMAARRGNVEVAEALLDCGAAIDAKDSLGETPLRRAVNLDQTGVAALLISRGADVQSRGSKDLTPLLAARSSAMKRLLRRE